MSPRNALCSAALLALCLRALPAVADTTAADEHFKRGLELAKASEYDAAVEQFQRAHALSPHFAVLYNLGQAHVLAGRPVEAASILKRYLEEGDNAIPAKRREQVELTIAKCLSRTGVLRFDVHPPSASVWIDGVERESSSGEVRLIAGQHTVMAQAPGHVPAVAQVTLPAGREEEFNVRLALIPSAPAFIEVDCELPAVSVSVEGKAAATTPLHQPLQVMPGQHVVRFSRSGYLAREKAVLTSAGRRTEVSCDLGIDRRATAALGARLKLVPNERDAEVLVDGVPLEGQALPPGPHHVVVRREGFKPWSRDLTLAPQRTTFVDVFLEPTARHAKLYEQRADRYRLAALVGAGAGVALGGVAAALYATSANQFASWRAEREALDADLLDGHVDTSEVARSHDLSQRAARIQALDDAAFAMAATGGVVAVVSAAIWIFGPDPERYGAKPANTAVQSLGWRF